MGRGEGHYVSVTGGQGSQEMTRNQQRRYAVASERESRDVLTQRFLRNRQSGQNIRRTDRDLADEAYNNTNNLSDMSREYTRLSELYRRPNNTNRNRFDGWTKEQIQANGLVTEQMYNEMSKEQQSWYDDMLRGR